MMLISRNKVGVVSSLVFGLTLGAVGLAGADSPVLGDRSSFEPKVTICHATNAEDNPYNKIEVAQSAVDGTDGGHRNHTADIIPPTDGVTELNWSDEGKSTFNNDCMVTEVQTPGEPKVTICHATNAENNPYNKITVSRSAVDDGGHRNHTGPVWYPGAKDAGVHWGDIIPPTDGVTELNWPEGESTFNNDCQLPGTSKVKAEKPKTRETKTTDEDE